MEKKKIIISSITVAVLLVLVVASTYAYFQARITNGGQTSTNVTAKTLDSFAINTGRDISLVATQDNFGSGKGDLSSSTTATVSFTARNDTASSYAYRAGIYIKENDFIYSHIGDEDKGLGLVSCDISENLATNPVFEFEGNSNVGGKLKGCSRDYRFDGIYEYNIIWLERQDLIGKSVDAFLQVSSLNSSSNVNFDVVLGTPKTNFTLLDTIENVTTITTDDEKNFYKLSFNIPEDIDSTYTYIGINVTFNSTNSSFLLENIRIIDKNSNLGQSYSVAPYKQSETAELELKVKRNNELIGTWDITEKVHYDISYGDVEWKTPMYFKNIDDTNYPNPHLYSKYRYDTSYTQAQYQYFKNAYSTEYPSVAECADWNCVLSILESE